MFDLDIKCPGCSNKMVAEDFIDTMIIYYSCDKDVGVCQYIQSFDMQYDGTVISGYFHINNLIIKYAMGEDSWVIRIYDASKEVFSQNIGRVTYRDINQFVDYTRNLIFKIKTNMDIA
jgi:hypothetical protein